MSELMKASAATQKTRRKLFRTVFERIEESKWGKHLANVYLVYVSM